MEQQQQQQLRIVLSKAFKGYSLNILLYNIIVLYTHLVADWYRVFKMRTRDVVVVVVVAAAVKSIDKQQTHTYIHTLRQRRFVQSA